MTSIPEAGNIERRAIRWADIDTIDTEESLIPGQFDGDAMRRTDHLLVVPG